MNRKINSLGTRVVEGLTFAFYYLEDLAIEYHRLSEFIIVGLIPAFFVTLLLVLAGIRDPGVILLLFLVSFLLIGGISLSLPRETEPEVRLHRAVYRQFKSRFDQDIAPLVESLQKRESRRPELFKIHPPIEDDAIISASIYLSRGGYNAANLCAADNVITRIQERKLRNYMLKSGLAYQFRDGDRIGWSLNAAGRAMIREYITQLLLDEIDTQLSEGS